MYCITCLALFATYTTTIALITIPTHHNSKSIHKSIDWQMETLKKNRQRAMIYIWNNRINHILHKSKTKKALSLPIFNQL